MKLYFKLIATILAAAVFAAGTVPVGDCPKALENRDSPMRVLLTQKGQSPTGTVPVLLAPGTRVGGKAKKKSSRVMRPVVAEPELVRPPDVIPIKEAKWRAITRALGITWSVRMAAEVLGIARSNVARALSVRRRSSEDFKDSRQTAVPSHVEPWKEEKRRRILEAVEAAGGNYSIAAKWLGVGRHFLYRHLPPSESSAKEKIIQALRAHNGDLKETAKALRVSEQGLAETLRRYEIPVSEKTEGLPEDAASDEGASPIAYEIYRLTEKLKERRAFTKGGRQKDLYGAASRLKQDPSNMELELDLLAQLAHVAPEVLPVRRGKKQEPTRAQLEAAVAMLKRIPLDEAQSATGGYVAELVSGEGKTLALALAAAVEAAKGGTVHVMTANNYLAQWSAMEMAPLFVALGLSVAVLDADKQVQHQVTFNRLKGSFELVKHPRRATANIVYGEGSTFVYDFLFDRMRMSSDRVQHHHDTLLIDEIDSILIDEATTPLVAAVLSREKFPSHSYARLLGFARGLLPGVDFTLYPQKQLVELTERGKKKLTAFADTLKKEFPPVEWLNFEKEMPRIVTQLLRAEYYFRCNVHYTIKDEQVVLVDEYTGRLEPDRRFAFGLHEAIAAKEHLPIPPAAKELGGITFPQYLRLYNHVAGTTGVIGESGPEFWRRYHLQPLQIAPANEPQREDLPDLIFKTKEEKLNAVVGKMKDVAYREKRPIIVGVRTIEESYVLSQKLRNEGMVHQVLNGLQDEEEAKLIERAGMLDENGNGMVTIVTNIAGRGTDFLVALEALSRGGIFILGTERHSAKRIDWQLRGRGGRQGEKATSQFYISLEDELIQDNGEAVVRRLVAALKLPEDHKGPIEDAELHILIDEIQESAEAKNRALRDHNLSLVSAVEFQRWLVDELREFVRSVEPIPPRKHFHNGLVQLWRRAHPARELFDINVLNLTFLSVADTKGPQLFKDHILKLQNAERYRKPSHRLAEAIEARWMEHWAKMRRLEGELLSSAMPVTDQRKVYEEIAAKEWEDFLRGIAREYDYLTQNDAVTKREDKIRSWLKGLIEKSHRNRREFQRLLNEEAPDIDLKDAFAFIKDEPLLEGLFVAAPRFSSDEYKIFKKALGRRFREERERLGLEKGTIVERAGFKSKNQIDKAEKGEASLSIYVKIQEAMGIDMLSGVFHGDEWLMKSEPTPLSQAVGEATIGAIIVGYVSRGRLPRDVVDKTGFGAERLEKGWDGIGLDWQLLAQLGKLHHSARGTMMERLYGILIAGRKSGEAQRRADGRSEIAVSQLAPQTRFNGTSELTMRRHIWTAVRSMVRISKIEGDREWTIGAGWIRKSRKQSPPSVITANHIIKENGDIRHICLEQLGTGLATNGIIYVEPSMGRGLRERDLIVLDAIGCNKIDGRVFQEASAVELIDPGLLRSGEELFVIGCHLHQGNQVSVIKMNFVATVGGFVFIESPQGRLDGFSGSGIFKIDADGPRLVGIISGRSGIDEALCGPSSALISRKHKKQFSQDAERSALSRFKTYEEGALYEDTGFHQFEIKGQNVHYEVEKGSVVICSDMRNTDSIDISEFTQPRGICAIGFKNGRRHMVFANLSDFNEENIRSVFQKMDSLNLESVEVVAFCPNPVRSQVIQRGRELASNGANIPVVSWNAKKEDVAVSATTKGICFAGVCKGELRPTSTYLWHTPAMGLSGEIEHRTEAARSTLAPSSRFEAPSVTKQEAWRDLIPSRLQLVVGLGAVALTAAFGAPQLLMAGIFFGSSLGGDDLDKAASGIREGRIGIGRAIKILRDNDYPEMIERAIWDVLGRASYDDALIILNMQEGKHDKAINCRARLFARVLERLEHLLAVDKLIEISGYAGKSALPHLRNLASRRDLQRELRIKVQLRIFYMACDTARPDLSDAAEGAVAGIGFENMEYETLVGVFLSGVFKEKYRLIFSAPSYESRFVAAIKDGIDRLTPEQIRDLHPAIKGEYANRIARHLEVLCLNEDTSRRAVGVLLDFNKEYPLESLNVVARLSTDEMLALDARNEVQKRIIDLHFNKSIEVRAALRENAPLIEYDSFEFESLVYADSKGVQPVRVKLALARRLINLSLEEIAGLSSKMRSEFKMTIAKRLAKLTLQGEKGALDAFLRFSGEYGIYTAGSFRNIFKMFESNAERTRFVLERVIELNFTAKDEKSRSAMGAVIDAYGAQNIPMPLLLTTVRSERFRGSEQGRYSRALEKKFLPVKIKEVLEAMRKTTHVVDLPNILSTIAEKIDAEPAGVSLLQFAQSDNAEERLASVEPLCSMLRRPGLPDDARASIEAQLMQFVLEDKDKLVREKSRDAFARIGLRALSLKTLLYAYEKGAAIDELAPNIEGELTRRLAGLKKAKDILKAVEDNKSYASIFIRHLGGIVASTGDIETLSALEHILKDEGVSLSDKFSAIHPLCLAAVNAAPDRAGVRRVATELAVGLMKHLDIKEDAKALSPRAISSLEEALLDSNTPLAARTRLLEYFTRSKNEIIKKKEFLRSLLARAPNRPLTKAEVSFYDVIVKATKPLLDAPSIPHLFRLYENTDDPKLRRHIVRNVGLIRQAAASSDKLHGYLASAVLKNLDEELIRELIWANGEIENKKAEGLLTGILKDNSKPEDMRKACAVALGKISYDRGLIATISRIALSLGWEDEVLEGIRSGIEYRFSWRATADERSAQLLDEIHRLHEKGQLEEVFGKEARGLKDYLDNVKAGIGGDDVALYLPEGRFIVRGVQTTNALEDIMKRGVQKPLKDTAGASYAEQGESYFSRTLDYVLGGFTSESGAVMFVPTEFYNEELSLNHVKLGKRVVGIFVFSEGVPREKIRFLFIDERLFGEIKKIKDGGTSSAINVTADDLADFDLIGKDEISEGMIAEALEGRHCKIIEVKRKDGESYESAVRRLLDSPPLKSHLKRAKEERLQELTIKGYAQRWLSNNKINSEWWHQLAKGRRLREDLGELSEGSLGSHAGGWAKHKKTGARYYVKFLDDVDQLRAEYVAWRFYKELGFNVSDEMYLVRAEFGGRQKWALVSKEIDGFKSGLDEELFHHKKVVERYLADCWLQNRDGPKNDNNGVNRNGEPACLDFGSSLDCRAKARERKEFTVASMVELMDTFFDPSLSVDPTFFRHATYDDKVNSARKISQLTDDAMRSIVYSAGYENAATRDAIIRTLIDSKYFLMGKFKIGGEESMEALYDLFTGSDEEFVYKMKGFNRFVPFEIKELMSKPSGRSKGKTIWDHTMIALDRLDTEDISARADLDLKQIVRAVVFMHDIGKAYGHEGHEKKSAELMVKYLPQMGFSQKEVLVALEIMRKNKFGDILQNKIPVEEFALLAVHKSVAGVVTKREVFAMSLAYYMADVTSGRRLKEQVTEKSGDGRRYIKEGHAKFYDLVKLMEQKEAARALADTYNGAMLDIDGTITDQGELDTSVVVRIANLLRQKVFVALATGRRGDKEEIGALVKALAMRGLTERDLAYLRIFTDNGAICFLGNGELDEGYLNQWPKNYSKDKAEKFLEGLFKKIKGAGRFEIKPREFYIRIKVEDANAFFMARQLNKVIRNMSLPLKIMVSGKGSIDVAPTDAHKGRALEYFREVIAELGRHDLKEVKVLTIGNRGEPEGNDYPMLTESGFTVGGKRKDSLTPLRAYKGKGDALEGSDGTTWLLENAKFKPSSVDPASFEILEYREVLAHSTLAPESRFKNNIIIDRTTGAVLGTFKIISKEEFAKLNNVTIKNFHLDKLGVLSIGGRRSWGIFSNYPGRLVEIDVEQGLIVEVRIYDEKGRLIPNKDAPDGRRRFLVIIDRSTGNYRDSFGTRITAAKFCRLTNVTIRGFHLTENGSLSIAGQSCWARFANYSKHPIEIDVDQGVITEVRIYDKLRGKRLLKTNPFAIIVDRESGRYIDSFWDQIPIGRLKQLGNVTIKKLRLTQHGVLNIGGNLGLAGFTKYSNYLIEVDSDKGIVTEVRIYTDDGELVCDKKEAPDGRRRFALVVDRKTGALKGSFWARVFPHKLSSLTNVTIRHIRLDNKGVLAFGGRHSWANFCRYPRHLVELDIDEGIITEARIYDKKEPDRLLETVPFKIARDPQGNRVHSFAGRLLPKRLAEFVGTITGYKVEPFNGLKLRGNEVYFFDRWGDFEGQPVDVLFENKAKPGQVTSFQIGDITIPASEAFSPILQFLAEAAQVSAAEARSPFLPSFATEGEDEATKRDDEEGRYRRVRGRAFPPPVVIAQKREFARLLREAIAGLPSQQRSLAQRIVELIPHTNDSEEETREEIIARQLGISSAEVFAILRSLSEHPKLQDFRFEGIERGKSEGIGRHAAFARGA